MLQRVLLAGILLAAGTDAFSVAPSGLSKIGLARQSGPLCASRGRIPLRRSGISMMASSEDEFASMERVRFEGESCIYTEEVDGNEVGVVQAAKPLTPENPYFEIEIENGGTMSWIGMGIASKGYDGDKQPGWAVASAGYHADDGCYYKAPRMDDRNAE